MATPLEAAAPRVMMRPLDVFATSLMRPEQSPEIKLLIPAILAIMSDIKDIPKTGFNKEQKYNYVEASAVTALVQDACVKNGVWVAQREIEAKIFYSRVKGSVLVVTYQYDFYHSSGQFIRNACTGSGSCRFEAQSGVLDDKAFGKAITACGKTAILSAFRIPSDVDRDIERDEDARFPSPPARGRDDRRDDDRPPPRDDDRRDDRPPPRDDRPPPRDDRPPPRDDDRRDDRRRDEPGGPPPRWDDIPPFDGPSAGFNQGSPPDGGTRAATTEERDQVRQYQENVTALGRSLKAADTQAVADQIWIENAELLRQMADNTYEDFRLKFTDRWGVAPPK